MVAPGTEGSVKVEAAQGSAVVGLWAEVVPMVAHSWRSEKGKTILISGWSRRDELSNVTNLVSLMDPFRTQRILLYLYGAPVWLLLHH